MRKIILALAAATSVVTMAAPAAADPPPWAPAHGRRAHDRQALYNAQGAYYEPRVMTRNDYVWRGNDGQYYCRRDNGTTGLIVGAAAGALLGREVDGGRDRTLGTILGAAGGALIGRAIDRGEVRCR